MDLLRIHLLGPLTLQRDGESVGLSTRKAEALLAVLAVKPGVASRREWLTALLWPDVPEAQGRASLRQAVSLLRRALGGDGVRSAGDQLFLDPAGVWVDLAELERIVARAAVERGPAAELWRGELLQGFPAVEEPFAAWLASERARTGDWIAAKLEECLAALSATGQLEAALRVGTWVLERDPTRESTHRAVMALHADRGDRSAAARQYERCRDALQRHLGLGPSAATEALRATLRTAPAAPEPEPSAALTARAEDGRLRLVVHAFEPLPNEGRAALLAAGLTDDLRTELSRFRQLAVVVPDASPRPEDVAARLSLRGTVLIAGDRTRVTASLLDATTGLQLWAERWEPPADEVLTVLERLTQRVVGELSLKLDAARLERARRLPRERLEVYECWLRGMESLRRGNPVADDEARAFFEQALRLSPGFARAYAGLSLSHFNDWSCQAWDRWELRERLAYENAERAVELDDGDHLPHVILGRICLYRREFARAERHLECSLARNANDPDALIHAAVGFTLLGQVERGRALCERAFLANAPGPAWYHAAAGGVALLARRPAEAVRCLERAPDLFVDGRAFLAIAAFYLGDVDTAREHAARFVAELRHKVTRGKAPARGEALQWFLQVNPLRRAEDQAYLVAGLLGAGLDPAGPDAAGTDPAGRDVASLDAAGRDAAGLSKPSGNASLSDRSA